MRPDLVPGTSLTDLVVYVEGLERVLTNSIIALESSHRTVVSSYTTTTNKITNILEDHTSMVGNLRDSELLVIPGSIKQKCFILLF